MNVLTVNEVATLKGCSDRQVRYDIESDKLYAETEKAVNGRPRYLIPLSALDAPLQRKWYRQNGMALPAGLTNEKRTAPAKVLKPLDFYSADQRQEIDGCIALLEDWQAFRRQYPGSKGEADKTFIRDRRLDVSSATLYRKLTAYRASDWDGLLDKRGQANKGKSDFPAEIRDTFEYFYLDEHAINIKKCLEATKHFFRQQSRHDLLDQFPSYQTALRWAQEVPLPIACLAREGDKAFDDNYGLYVDRIYDDMLSNDFWIADGHTIDVITRSEDGKERQRRMTLTAFIDARSGVYVGWVITENPSTDATLLALRKAIRRYGVPRYLYVDNGREYLNYDIGGMGHRQKKTLRAKINVPTPVLSRLGIQMVNALPRNARAKLIEREFKNFTFLSSLFATYVGSNVVVKPEKLKHKLKSGQIPTDSELYEVVEAMIEGYFNCQDYNGKAVEDRGLPKIQVYHDNLPQVVRRAAEEDLNILMMRSTRTQTVRENGIYVTVSGEKVFYYNDELLRMAGQKVFVRYDPEVMNEVRVYDESEAYLLTAPLHPEMMLTYFASKEEISAAMSQKRRYKKVVKQEIAAKRQRIADQYGHISMLDLMVRISNDNREGLLVTSGPAPAIELVRPEERRPQLPATGTDGPSPSGINKSKIISNNERRQQR